MESQGLPIIDCHQHFIDAHRLRYPVFMQRSARFEALVGDYGALPRIYLPEDYARDVNGLGVVKTVWGKFISNDPMGEVTWAQELAHTTGRPQGMIGLVDFSSPGVERTLDLYTSIEPVRAVRQHLGWHPTNPLLRYAPRPEILSDTVWQNGLPCSVAATDCQIEIFGSQLPSSRPGCKLS